MVAANLAVGGVILMDTTAERIGTVETGELEFSKDYEELCASDYMRILTETNDVRMEEEQTRPRVEIWPDDLEWQQWVSQHEPRRRSLICHLLSMKSSPFCASGYH
jgi:hypothetical protein